MRGGNKKDGSNASRAFSRGQRNNRDRRNTGGAEENDGSQRNMVDRMARGVKATAEKGLDGAGSMARAGRDKLGSAADESLK